MAYAFLNLKPYEFWDKLSPRDFLMMCEGYNTRFRLDYNMQLAEMRLTRWVGSLIYNTNVKKGHQKDADKLYPLYELDEKEIEVPTRDDWDRIKKEQESWEKLRH